MRDKMFQTLRSRCRSSRGCNTSRRRQLRSGSGRLGMRRVRCALRTVSSRRGRSATIRVLDDTVVLSGAAVFVGVAVRTTVDLFFDVVVVAGEVAVFAAVAE